MHHHVDAGERHLQGLGITDVALAVLHLGPAPLGRVERTARDPDDPGDAVVVLQEGDQPRTEGAGGAGDRDREIALAGGGVRVRGFPRTAGSVAGTPLPGGTLPGGTHVLAAAVAFFDFDSFLATAMSSSMPFRIPPDRTSTSGKASKSALIPKVIVLR